MKFAREILYNYSAHFPKPGILEVLEAAGM